jgi:hypothetical protein
MRDADVPRSSGELPHWLCKLLENRLQLLCQAFRARFWNGTTPVKESLCLDHLPVHAPEVAVSHSRDVVAYNTMQRRPAVTVASG